MHNAGKVYPMRQIKRNSRGLSCLAAYEQVFGPITVRPSVETLEFWGLKPRAAPSGKKKISRSAAGAVKRRQVKSR
jgi:hypothetical protein